MTIKEFKDKSIPELDFEIQKEKHLLVQCFFHKSELASQLIGIEKQATEIKNAFKVFEIPGQPGKIKAESLVKALCTYGVEKLTEAQAKDLVSQLETDINGFINYAEYVNMMMTS